MPPAAGDYSGLSFIAGLLLPLVMVLLMTFNLVR